MVNLWNMIDNYLAQHSNGFSNDKEDMLTESLTRDEKAMYDMIKESDRQRLIRFS